MVYLQNQDPKSWMGYVKSFSEAAMVGALADWFAVTALFRYPLGLKIPHTNLIERKKNDLGDNLGAFVKDNFLNTENIRPYIEQLNIVSIASNWLNKPSNQILLENEISKFLYKLLNDLDEKEVVNFLSQKGSDLLTAIDYPKIASNGINYLIEKNEAMHLLDSILPQLKNYVNENQNLIRNRIAENKPFIAFLAGKRISKELTEGIIAFIEEIQVDDNHFLRQKINDSLQNLAYEVEHSPKWKTKIENLKNELITPQKIEPYAKDAWKATLDSFNENLAQPNSTVRLYIQKNIAKLAHNLDTDLTLKTKINAWIQRFIYSFVLRNREEVQKLISKTVEGWKGKELSQKLELEVGKDLQFIRINGTLVGGLVGLIIYIVTQLFNGVVNHL